MTLPSLTRLREEFDLAIGYSNALTEDLTEAEIQWRPEPDSSAIGWHLGHQAAVAHYLVRNLTAAEPEIDPELDRLMDSATSERDRGVLPDLDRLRHYRDAVAERVRFRIGAIDDGNVGAPAQLRLIAGTLMVAAINHEYQHAKWIGEVRVHAHGKELPDDPESELLTTVDGYLVLTV